MTKAFLNVENSLTQHRWVGPTAMQDRAAEALVQSSGVDLILARVLARIGIPPEDASAYLTPRLKDLMPDPRHLIDMDKASKRLIEATTSAQRIAIFADYDVDGGSSAALLIRWLRDLGTDTTLYVPDRALEGYGPNVPAMQTLAANHDLIICVDCGTLSHEAIAAAKGCDVIVVDHHLGGTTLPPAFAIINPNRQDESSPLNHLCAAAVVFMLLVECNRQLRKAGKACPDLMSLLDLVALATVADVAPLKGLNRAFVRQGLTIMARRHRAGLVALFDLAGLDSAPASYHLGFVLGPRLNAGGRIGQADLGARLLATDNPSEAQALAAQLDALNTERRRIEGEVRQEALAQIEARGATVGLAWAAGEGWNPGVLGIVASRVKEFTGLPSVVLGLENGEAKGSGRSISGVDLGTSIQRLVDEGLIDKGGGHAMAAGLSLKSSQLEPAMQRLSVLLGKQQQGLDASRTRQIDGIIMPEGISPEIVEGLEAAGPFGAGNPAPRFALPDQIIRDARRVGENHLKLSFTDPGAGGGNMDAISFGAFDGPLGSALEGQKGGRFHLVGQLDINYWQGRRKVQLRLEDAAPTNPQIS